MVIYKFFLKPKGSSDSYEYALDLNLAQEDNPVQIFNEEIRHSLKTTLEQKSLCTVRHHHLEKIIQVWIEDISEGYRDTYLTLELPLIIESQIEQLQDQGNRELPQLFPPDLKGIEPSFGMLPPLEQIYQL